jgi:hypothetical protein
MFKVLGITLIVLALVLAVVPHYTDCQSQGSVSTLANGKTIPMKCHWTGVAEVGVAAPLVAVGAMMSFNKRKQGYIMLSILGIVAAAAAISLPTFLIGTCPTQTHICNTVMKPAIIGIGSAVGLVSILGLVISTRSNKDI